MRKDYCNHLDLINTSYFVSPLSLTRSPVLTSQICDFLFVCSRTPKSSQWPTAGDLIELCSYDSNPAYTLVVSPSKVPSPCLNTFFLI